PSCSPPSAASPAPGSAAPDGRQANSSRQCGPGPGIARRRGLSCGGGMARRRRPDSWSGHRAMRNVSALPTPALPSGPQAERRRTRRDAPVPDAIARTILAGFDRHYSRFRYHAQLAKGRYEAGDFHAIRRLASERIAFYDLRVREAMERLEKEFHAE